MQKFEPFDVPLRGTHLVEASAGTGKTYNITSLCIRCLIEERVDIGEILILTYTRAATEELKERVLRRLRQSQSVLSSGIAPEGDEFLNRLLDEVREPEKAVQSIEKALRNFDEASIFTIHGFCQRALLEQSFLSGISFGGELLTDDSDYIRDAVEDQWRKLVAIADEDRLEQIWLNIIREEGYRPDMLADIVKRGVGKSYLELTPGRTGRSDRRSDLERLMDLFNELDEIWNRDKSELRETLLSEEMNGNRYRRSSVEKWFLEMDEWLSGDFPVLSPFDRFDRFSISFIKEKGIKKGKEAPEHLFFEAVDRYISHTGVFRDHLSGFKIELLEQTDRMVMDRKLEAGLIGYDDLLILLRDSLKRSGEKNSMAEYLRSRYPVAMVDEFQDTDPVQYQILSSIYEGRDDGSALFLIGDPKQSIYSFRGADVFSYLKARSGISETNKYGLDRNFRSRKGLIRAVNKLFGRIEKPFLVEEIVFNPATPGNKSTVGSGDEAPSIRFLCSSSMDPDLQLAKGESSSRAAEVTAESIARSLHRGEEGAIRAGDRPVTAKDIAVLVRTHKQAELIRESLALRKIKSVQYSQKSVFDTEEARDMISLLKAMAEPGNESLIRVVLSSDLFPHTASDLVQLQENEQQWFEIIGLFGELNRIWNEYGFARAFKVFLKKSRVEQEIILLKNGERKLTNFLQLGELLQIEEREKSPGPHELIRWLIHKYYDSDENSDEEQLRLESDVELVKIVTLHRSKGLEYPVTYCPFLWYGPTLDNTKEPFIYHNPQKGYKPCLDLGEKGDPVRDEHRYWAALEEISEGMRLAYVALTRAKEECNIIYEPCSGMEYSSLGYLLLGYKQIAGHLEEKIISDGKTDSIPVYQYFSALKSLTEEDSSLIGLEQVHENERTEIRENQRSAAPKKPNRTFSNYLATRSNKQISSFSSIMHPAYQEGSEEELGSDEFFMPEERGTLAEEVSRSIFSFPKGPEAGTCIHKVFEDLQFNGDSEKTDVIKRNLEIFGFDPGWTDVVGQMVSSVLGYDLNGEMRLSDIRQDDMVKEMEFHFDLLPFHRDKILEAIRGNFRRTDTGITVPEGFMKGYIDLVFRHEGRYYIADYKTNHLGDLPEDYSFPNMHGVMVTSGYDVQYHIYLLALHRFLQERLESYSYEEHMGGVFYLFVRGMGHNKEQEGVFFNRPETATMEYLDRLFKEGETG